MTEDFDGLLVATGVTNIARNIQGSELMRNISFLSQRSDHETFSNALKSGIKKLTVFGLSLESLELVSTIRREYPKVSITVIDDNRESVVQEQYGTEVAKSIIQ